MAQEFINIGAYPNDANADPVRVAFLKTQNNISELYTIAQASGVNRLIPSDGITTDTQTGNVTIKANIAKITINTDNNLLIGIGTATASSAVATSSNNVFSLKVANNFSTANITATNFYGTLKTASQPNITSVGTLTNLVLSSNGAGLTTPSVTSNNISANSIVATTISATGGNTQILFNNNSVVGASSNLTFDGSNLQVIGNITVNNANLGNTVTANYVNATITSTSNNQPNITTLGKLSNLSVSGNISVDNNVSANNFSGNFIGNFSGNYVAPGLNTYIVFNDNGNLNANSKLKFDGSNLTINGNFFSYNASLGNLATANYFNGTLSSNSNSQPNITSLGTLSSLQVAGTATLNNLVVQGTINSNNASMLLKDVIGVNIGNISGFANISGNVVSGNYLIGEGSNISNVTGANVVGNVNSAITSYFANVPNTATSGAYFLALTSTSTGNVRLYTNSNFGFNADTGTLNSNNFVATQNMQSTTLITTGNASVGNLSTSGTISTSGNLFANYLGLSGGLNVNSFATFNGLNSKTDISVNTNITAGGYIANSFVRTPLLTTGSTTGAGVITGYWSLSAGSRLNATFADLAEVYAGNKDIEPGTVVDFDGDNEVMETYRIMSTKVAGIVSSEPAHVLNSNMKCDYPVIVALAGRVPCKVVGKVSKGDMMVSAGGGRAMACESPRLGTVIGKSLENFNGDIGVIEIAVGRF